MCCTEGSITFDWLVERSGFISGEDIWIQGSVQNDSKHTVTQSMVTLFMVSAECRPTWVLRSSEQATCRITFFTASNYLTLEMVQKYIRENKNDKKIIRIISD